jgi:hypothetical protein
MIRLIPARLTHVGPLASNMRETDRRECEALGRTPREALRGGLRCSLSVFTAIDGQIPVAMLGVVPEAVLGGVGRVWLLGTDRVFANPRALLRLGPLVFNEWLGTFSRLENIISLENEPALRLLRRWGFSIADETEVHGGVEFVRFWRERMEPVAGIEPASASYESAVLPLN